MHYLHVTKKLLSDHQAAALLAPHGSFTRHLIVSLYNRFPQQMLQHFVSHFILIGSVHQPQTWGWLRKIVLAKSHVLPFIIGAPDNQSKWPGNDFWCRKSNVCWFISDLIATSVAVIYYAGERHPELHSDGRVWHLFVNLPADAGCEPFMQCVNVRVMCKCEGDCRNGGDGWVGWAPSMSRVPLRAALLCAVGLCPWLDLTQCPQGLGVPMVL